MKYCFYRKFSEAIGKLNTKLILPQTSLNQFLVSASLPYKDQVLQIKHQRESHCF